jgi:enoyl-CoA hydratase/carnithine racemase
MTPSTAPKPTTQVVSNVVDRVGHLLLDGAQVLNALHSTTHEQLAAAVGALDERADVGAIVLIGAGRAFCAGSDLREVGALTGVAAQRYIALDFATKNAIAGSRTPVVAAIRGHCVGGGLELALACDVRIAARDAVFAFPEVPLGSLPGSGGLQRLPAVVGVGVATDWILSGRTIDADEAYARGLVTRLVDASELDETAHDVGTQLAARSATALWLAKVALHPSPPADRGMVAAFQMLAGDACHADPDYARATERFTRQKVADD